MVQLDPKRTNNITESQFVEEILKNYDEYELSEIIVSELIPKNTLEELNMHPKISSDSNDVMKNIRSKTNLRRVRLFEMNLIGCLGCNSFFRIE